MPYSARSRFVSLFFTSSKVQLVYLSSDKRSVEKYATFDIPEGVISSRKVVDSTKLAGILKGIWKELGLREKFVGVVVPEFSTYIKAIKLPKMEKENLAEAVFWQASDVMPTSQTDTVIDWKIIDENDEGYTILVASIKKDVLTGYVDAISKAGLSPLVLETPSLSLSRVTDHDNFGKLVIYQSFNEAIVVVAMKENIFGSSISGLGDDNVLSTAIRIGHYYKGVKIEKILVGGINLTQNLLNNLSEKFAIKPEWIQVLLSGMTVQQLQEYMIPISLSLKKPLEPSDETTINLLPIDWAKGYEFKRLKSKVRKLMIDTLLVVAMLLIISVGFYMSLNIRFGNIKNEVSAADQTQAKEFSQKATDVNTMSQKVIKISDREHTMQQVIPAIYNARVEGVDIKNLTLNFETGAVNIDGFSPTRLGLIDFKKNLDNMGLFEGVDIPLSALEKDADIDFEISLNFKKAVKTNTGVIQIPSDFVKQ